jgi:rod shape-determining protein MreC
MRNLLNFLTRYNNLIVFLLLEAVAIYFLTTSNSYHSSVFLGSVRSVTAKIEKRAGAVTDYLQLRDKNHVLAIENLRLREELEMAVSQLALAGMADSSLTRDFNYEWSLVKVVNNSVSKQRNFITLDRGSNDGIETDMAVAGPDGVVGIVVSVSNNFSIAMSLLNLDFRMSVRLKKNSYFGSLTWDGHSRQQALLNEIPYHVDVVPGDTIETSGYSAVFPAGLMVGVVSEVDDSGGDFYRIRIDLSSDFGKLNYLYIIKNRLQDEQTEMEGEVKND